MAGPAGTGDRMAGRDLHCGESPRGGLAAVDQSAIHCIHGRRTSDGVARP